MNPSVRLLVLLTAGVLLSASSPAASSTESVFTTSFLSGFDDASGKIVSLADKFSDAQFDWRPGPGVRSSKEVLLHIATANYMISAMIGSPIPDGVKPQEFEKSIKTNDETIAVLKKSIAHARAAIANLTAADFETMVSLWGQKAPKLRAVLIIGEHANEHLGQLIAYARVNNVAPPWSK